MINREFTAVYKKRGNRYIAWIEEVPGVNTQGKTKTEAKENLREALYLILSANRDLAARQHDDGMTVRESLRFAIPA